MKKINGREQIKQARARAFNRPRHPEKLEYQTNWFSTDPNKATRPHVLGELLQLGFTYKDPISGPLKCAGNNNMQWLAKIAFQRDPLAMRAKQFEMFRTNWQMGEGSELVAIKLRYIKKCPWNEWRDPLDDRKAEICELLWDGRKYFAGVR